MAVPTDGFRDFCLTEGTKRIILDAETFSGREIDVMKRLFAGWLSALLIASVLMTGTASFLF